MAIRPRKPSKHLGIVARRLALAAAVLLLGAGTGMAAPRVGEAIPNHELLQTDSGPLSLPSDVAIAPTGRVWVVDSGRHRIAAFDPHGQFLFAIGGPGTADGQFRDPLGLGVDPKGQLYVADAGNHRIQVFDPNGKFLTHFSTQDAAGEVRPIDVAPSPTTGELFITSNTRHNVLRYSARGELLGQWGKEGMTQGEFRYPATLVARDGLLYIVDVLNTRVQIFNERGEFQYQVGEWGVLPGQLFRPKGIALDSRGWIYVSDSYLELIQVFDTGYVFKHVLGRGASVHKFMAPTGLAIDATDRIYVTQMLGNKVSVFDLR